MENKDLQSIHDEIWAQLYEQQKRTREQQSFSTHSDNSSQALQSPDYGSTQPNLACNAPSRKEECKRQRWHVLI